MRCLGWFGAAVVVGCLGGVVSAQGVTTTYTVSFKPSANENIGSVKFQVCDSPVETNPCNQPSSASVLAAGLNTASPTTAPEVIVATVTDPNTARAGLAQPRTAQ